MRRTTGPLGEALIKTYEQGPRGGPALEAYKCPAGVWTIGWGHTRGVKEGDTCTRQQAETFLREDLRASERAVNDLVRVSLTQNQFDALVSFTLNLGRGSLAGSTLLVLLNEGFYERAADQFSRWVYSTNPKTGKKEILNGLVARRADEKTLFMTEDAPCPTRLD